MYQNTYRNFLFFGGIPPKKCNRLKKIDDNYTYDALNRITGARGVGNSNYDVPLVSYDKNGNILRLQRRGHSNNTATVFGVMDNLTYTYDSGNRLRKVADSGNKTTGFIDGAVTGNDYSYDVNGNMTVDRNKGISSITYNHLNLPFQLTINGNNYITYIYDANGVKQAKYVTRNGLDVTTTSYAGNYIYDVTPSGEATLQFFNHSEGYIKKDGNMFNYVYQYKDHLGNVRLSYTDNNKDGIVTQNEIIEESNYYPFGLKHKGYNNVVSSLGNSIGQKNKTFQGQEYHDELGLNVNEFKYRFYDPSNGRFWSVDPLAEDFTYNSTYAFAENKLGMGKELEGRELLNNQMLFDVIRLGLQGLQNISDKFSSGAKKTQKAYGEQMRQRAGVPNAEFDSESNRIEMATGIGQISEGATDSAHLAADIAGTIDQTGIVDGVHALTYLPSGEYGKATLTGIGILGIGGDALKLAKYSDEVAGAVGEGVKAVKSLAKADNKILKFSRETFESSTTLKNSANGLIEQLSKGNLNPGIGTKKVFGEVLEARSREGARVYFRQTNEVIEILGYSNKSNQQKVINRLRTLYNE